MGIPGDQVVAVVNLDQVAVFGMVFLRHHHAAGSRQDGRARRRWEIQPCMQGGSPVERVDSPAKSGPRRRRLDRLLRRHHHACLIFWSNRRDSMTVMRSTLLVGQRSRSASVACSSSMVRGRPTPVPRRARCALDLVGIDASQARDPLAQCFQLHQLGLHLAELAGHGVEVFTHEAVALLELVADHELDQRADDRPAFARALQEHPVVQGPAATTMSQESATTASGQPRTAQVNGRLLASHASVIMKCTVIPSIPVPSMIASCAPRHLQQATEDSPSLWQGLRNWRASPVKGSRPLNC
jgi:hypothetical protein